MRIYCEIKFIFLLIEADLPLKSIQLSEGEFGALMQVHIQNDGPVTIPIDTPPSLSTQKIKPQKPQKPKHSRNNDRNGENQCKVDDEAVDNVTHELAQL